MKRLMLYVVLVGVALCQAGSLGAVTLYDDFETDYFRKSLWTDFEINDRLMHEFVREVDNGVLVLKLGTNDEIWPDRQGVRLQPPIAGGLTSLRSDVRIMEMNNDETGGPPGTDTATVFGRLAGFFYNDTYATPPSPDGCFEGLIYAELALGDRGNGLEAWWEIERFYDCGSSDATTIAQGSLTLGPPQTPLVEGNWYTLEIGYDGGTGFTLYISGDGGLDLSNSASGPSRIGPPQFQWGALQACVQDAPGEWGDGYVHAEFDNVYLNDSEYDTFSDVDGLINQTRWRDREYVRESSGGVASLEVNSATEGRPRNQLFLRDRYTPYHEATATLDGTSVLYNGAVGRVRVSGIYYNRVHGPGSYNGYEGDVFAQAGLEQDSAGNRSAVWRLFQFTNAEGTAWTRFDGGILSASIAADTPYLLSITWTGTGFTFRCGSDTYDYNVSGTNNPPFGADRRVAVILFLDSGESGFIKGTFDNVWVADPAYTNLTGDWSGSVTNPVVVSGVCVPGDGFFFDVSVVQNNTELLIYKDSGNLGAAGIISGARILTQSKEPDGDEWYETWADMTFSDAHNFSGLRWTKATFPPYDGIPDCMKESDIEFWRINGEPTADDQTLTVSEDSTDYAITLTGYDPDGDSLTFAVSSGPTNGALSGTAPNLFYSPYADYNGPDNFAFAVDDGFGGTDTGTVSIAVTPVNDPPVAENQSVNVAEDSFDNAITLSADDVDGDSLTFAVEIGPTKGSLSGTAPDLLYSPNPGYYGPDSFTCSVDDGNGGSDTGTVSIMVMQADNQPPEADDQTVTVAEDATDFAITLTGNDPDGDTLAFAVASGPTYGTLVGTSPDVLYTPDADYNGTDSFTFTVNDGYGGTDTGTVSITVTPVNDAPQCDDQSVRVDVNSTDNAIALTGDDIDGDTLTFAVVTGPTNGTLGGAAPDLLYSPDADYEGADSFTFSVDDSNGGSDNGTVTITVRDSSGGGGGGGCFIQSLQF